MCGACGQPKHFELPVAGDEVNQADFDEGLGSMYGFNMYSPCVHCGFFPEGGHDPKTYDVQQAKAKNSAWIAENGYTQIAEDQALEQKQALEQYANAVE